MANKIIISFNAEKLLEESVMFEIIKLFYNTKDIVLKTTDDSLQIKLKLEDFFNPHHAIRKTIIDFPKKQIVLSNQKIIEEYFDINDEFVISYINHANNWDETIDEKENTSLLEKVEQMRLLKAI